MTYNNLPIYQAIVDFDDNNTGMICISLVDEPAVEADFLAFDKDNQPLQFKVENEEQRMVFGLVMAADMPIYRRTDDGYEYYITFSKDTIRTMVEKYFKEDKQNNVDTQHNFKLEDGVTMVQMFIKDSDNGINPVGFEDYKDGSLFAQFHIENDDVWESIKEGTYKGFSLAGNFNLEKMNINKPIEDTKTMSKLNRVKEMLKAMLQVFGDVATDKGTLMYDGDEEIKEGDAVKLLDGEGNEVEAEDGDYRTEDKRIIVVKEGKVAEIKDVKEEEPENPEETPAEDAPEEDVNASAEPEESATKQKFNAVKLAFELTYEEKYNKIYEAIKALGLEYFYIVQAADDFAVVASYEEDTEKLYKFDLTWNEDEVTASNQTEVKVEYVPVAEEPEPSNEEEPSTEPETEDKPEEEQMATKNEPAALSAQEAFAKLNDKQPNSKVNTKMEALLKRGYKLPIQ